MRYVHVKAGTFPVNANIIISWRDDEMTEQLGRWDTLHTVYLKKECLKKERINNFMGNVFMIQHVPEEHKIFFYWKGGRQRFQRAGEERLLLLTNLILETSSDELAMFDNMQITEKWSYTEEGKTLKT